MSLYWCIIKVKGEQHAHMNNCRQQRHMCNYTTTAQPPLPSPASMTYLLQLPSKRPRQGKQRRLARGARA